MALGLLARREHSQRELQNKLMQRGFDRAEIAAALAKLDTTGWQSETRYAEAYVRSRIERGFGEIRIRAELTQRGVDAAIAEDALNACQIDWSVRAEQLYRNRYRTAPKDDREAERRWRFMSTRGFTAAQIKKILGQFPRTQGEN